MRPLWIPEPVRLVLGVVAYQVHFLSSRGQFSDSAAYLYVFKCQRPPLVHVLHTAEWFILSYLERSLISQDIRRRAIPDVHHSFEGFSPVSQEGEELLEVGCT